MHRFNSVFAGLALGLLGFYLGISVAALFRWMFGFEEVWERHVDERYYKILSVDRVGFPLVHSEVDFRSPLRFGDRARVRVTCFRLGTSSIGLRYRFDVEGRECVDARMITACVDLAAQKSLPLPERYRAAFEKIRED